MATSQKSLRARWMDLLGEDGYRPHLEEDDDEPERFRIVFKSEGVRHVVYLHDKDPAFFNLSLTYRLGDYATAPDFALLAAANAENWEAKVTKVTVNLEARSAFFSFEGFCDELPSSELLGRMIRQASYSADRYFKRLKYSAKPVMLAS